MNIQKRNRLIAAVTVNIVLLLLILAAILIYQIVTICVLDKRKQELKDSINQAYENMNNASDMLEYYQSYDGLVSLVIENYEQLVNGGYILPNG